MYPLKFSLFLLCAIFGNPFYQMLSYFTCSALQLGNGEEFNTFQANILALLLVLVLIFGVRFLVYALIFRSKTAPFQLRGENTFLYHFAERHLFQIPGFFTLYLWSMPLEGNVIGFIVLPATLALGVVVSAITIFRMFKLGKILAKTNAVSEPAA
ncbi:MAG: hypothetical protein H6555_00950 [Lewinellaceae bacterium]|nr:hypothetical protein [Lewinellaceae bacterium]